MGTSIYHTDIDCIVASVFLRFSITWTTIPPVFAPPRGLMRSRTKKRSVRGQFITLEGPEGSGKSTHIRHLATALRRSGFKVVQTREPGGTVVAEAIRHTLLRSSSREQITPVAESLLIFAARSQHVKHVIKPALQRGSIVLCDRFSDSTLAYQGFARSLDLAWLQMA